MTRALTVRSCLGCSEDFRVTQHRQKYCTVACADKKNAIPTQAAKFGIPSGTVGALNELRVATDLMQKGYHVFRALSPACPCDLVVFGPAGQCLKVEVKTGHARRDGEPYIPKDGSMRRHDYDYVALVLIDRIVYVPELP